MQAVSPITAQGADQASLKVAGKRLHHGDTARRSRKLSAISFQRSASWLVAFGFAGSLRAREIVAACKETKN